MQSHDEGPCPDVIGKPGEAEENDGGHMVDDLFRKILQKREAPRDSSLFRCSSFQPPRLLFLTSQQLCPDPQEVKGEALHPRTSSGLFTHLSLDIRGNAEEQGPVEGKFNHVVPILRRDDALGEERGVRVPEQSDLRGTPPNSSLLAPSRQSSFMTVLCHVYMKPFMRGYCVP